MQFMEGIKYLEEVRKREEPLSLKYPKTRTQVQSFAARTFADRISPTWILGCSATTQINATALAGGTQTFANITPKKPKA